jgi:alkylation response protein AidB-like acyl-CoA dehydrogenase
MDEQLSPEQSQLRDSAARLCNDFGGAKRARGLRDRGEELDREAWQAMRAAGWLGTLVPDERGGAGLGTTELYVLLEQIGRHVAMVPLLEASAACWALGQAKSPGVIGALRSALAGERLLVPAMQAEGWDFRRPAALRGEPKGNAFMARGEVSGVVFAQSADEFLVRTETSGETLLCLLPRDHRGLEIPVARAVDGSCLGRLCLDNAAIDDAHIVARGDEAERLAAGMADLLSLGASIELLGLSETALALTLEHIKTRQQFGHPLGSFQALQHRVVDDFVALELNRSLLHRICLAWDAGEAQPALIAAAKARASRSTAEIMRTALQLHGAMGYTDEHDIGICFKRALVLAARYGNEFAQSEHFARLTAAEA